LYYEWPELDEAYEHSDQYMFGDDLMVAPVVAPANKVSGYAEAEVWLPPGRWTNWFTGKMYAGPRRVMLQVPLDEIPVFARYGAVIPTMPTMNRSDERPVDPLILNILPGNWGQALVYEDDGLSVGYTRNECAWTWVSHRLVDGKRDISIEPADGSFQGMLAERAYEVRLNHTPPVDEVLVDGQPLARTQDRDRPGWWYDTDSMSTIIRLPRRPVDESTQIRVAPGYDFDSLRSQSDGRRGLLRALGDVSGMMDEHGLTGPTPVDALRRESSQLTLDKCRAQLVGAWQAYVRAAGDTELPADVRRKALMRLFGLVCRCRARAIDAGDEHIELRLDMNLSRGGEASESTRSAKLHLNEPANCRLTDGGTRQLAEVPDDKPFSVKCTLRPIGEPQTTVVTGTLAVRLQDVVLDVPIREVLLPSVNHWMIVGPFDAPTDDRLQQVFPPEQDPRLEAAYEVQDAQEIGWRKFSRLISPETELTEEFYVEFHRVFGQYHRNAVAYAQTFLHAPRKMEVTLAVGSDDGVVVWLNGEEIHRNDVGRPYLPKQDRVRAHLNEGSNLLMLKISQGGGMWGFSVHIEDTNGQPVPEVRADLKP
jgi:hypothetical protein